MTVSTRLGAGLATFLSVCGLSTVWSSVVLLWVLWTTDALKSIGMVVPAVSFLLVLRAWRSLGWELEGTWWGFALLAATALLVRIRNHAVILLVLSPQWSLYVPPHSLVVFAYGAGVVLLFGGRRLFRAALFPLLLLLLVNPVPHVFNVYVDLPLQRASAHVARAFAIGLGQPLSPDKLRLMFTPEFGMFIAPGCNGIRGAITMGFIALVAGYLFRFRWRAHVALVLAAIALGYVFNFVRLCVLVLFYLVALHFPSLQDRAENADYLIGAGLFFVAVYLLYVVLHRVGGEHSEGVLTLPQTYTPNPEAPRSFPLRAAAMALLVCVGLLGMVHSMSQPGAPADLLAEERAMGVFPQKVGGYALVRTWNENLVTGALLFHWAEYAREEGGAHIALGISPLMGSHDTMVCHSARGEDPIWHGESTFRTLHEPASSFNASLYNDGATQFLELTTMCDGDSCGEYASPGRHFGIVYSRPKAMSLLEQSAGRTIPILLRAETVDTTLPLPAVKQQLAGDMAGFLEAVDLNALTAPYRKQ